MAHAMGVDFIEQDAVLTRDNELIVLHDLYLDAVTNVAQQFPVRQREDGRHYAIDFTLEEIKTLRVHERVMPNGEPEFPGRFPHHAALFRIPTLAEEITLIQGLNRSSGREVGVYIEPKSPAWHAGEGRNLVKEVISTLSQFGYESREDKACLQSFDTQALEYARHELETKLKLVQLIGENSWQESTADFNYLQTGPGLESLAGLVDGIGPWLMQLVDIRKDGGIEISDLVAIAHDLGFFVHGYTLRADQLPREVDNMHSAVDLLSRKIRLDGVFTDHPDQVVRSYAAIS